MKLWGGRFEGETDRLVERFTASIDCDRRLYRYDIAGSMAHARMLCRCGLVTERDKEQIIAGLSQIEEEIDSGAFEFDEGLEDIHMHIESRLIELIGAAGEKLHTARSRNDQVAVDMRLYMKDVLVEVRRAILECRLALVTLAGEHADRILPGFTHMQPAQPTTLGHHLLAYEQMLRRDGQRYRDLEPRVDVCPLGSCALAGTTLPIDREYTARLLGFGRVAENTMDAVSDRDFVLEFLSASAIMSTHLSRLCEELILWAAPAFNFIELPDAFCTGSSIMPQKKNPDVVELIRGKTGRIHGALSQVLSVLKGLPMSYNRDLQEDKEPLFDAVDTVLSVLRVFGRMLPEIRVNEGALEEAMREGFLTATDISDYLVEKGQPFRSTHRIVGRIVRYCIENGKTFADLRTAEWKRFSDLFEGDISEVITPRRSVAKRDLPGGPSPRRVREYVERVRPRLRERLEGLGG